MQYKYYMNSCFAILSKKHLRSNKRRGYMFKTDINIFNSSISSWLNLVMSKLWGWMVNYVSLTVEKLWKFVLLTKLGRDSCSVCSPALLEGQLLYRGSDAHLLLVCSTHQLVTQKTKLPSVSQVQFPKQRKQKEKPHVSF